MKSESSSGLLARRECNAFIVTVTGEIAADEDATG